jgi:Membrane transport protein
VQDADLFGVEIGNFLGDSQKILDAGSSMIHLNMQSCRHKRVASMITIILNSLSPVFFGMALGYLAGSARDVDNTHVAEFNALVMDFAVPASMFVTVVRASRRTLSDELPLAANRPPLRSMTLDRRAR